MPTAASLPRRSPLVGAANRVLPSLWHLGALPRPDFDPDTIRQSLVAETGLQDFGDPWFNAPLDVLCGSIREEACLNNVGRFGAIGQLRKMLKERLYAQHWFDRHPEILRRRIPSPVVVVGPMRSGTTRLHRLLAADGRFNHLKLFEAISPVPVPGFRRGGRDRRKLASAAILKLVHRLNPNTAVIHPTAPEAPEEELGLLVASIWGMKHEAQWRVPSYGRWAEKQDATPAYRHMARLLKLVGWARGEADDKPWVLKTPQHMLDLPALLKVFPDARILFIHRDPAAVVGSSCSLVYNQSIIHSDEVCPAEIGRTWLRKTELQVERMRAARPSLPPSRRLDVRYRDMETDWEGEMRRIYAFLGMDPSPALPSMRGYMKDAGPRLSSRPHSYRLSDFGLVQEQVLEPFEDYVCAFDLDEGGRATLSGTPDLALAAG
jgi:hypothetical protein